MLTGPGGFDRGIERQQVGLLGDFLDQGGNVTHAIRLLAQHVEQFQRLFGALGQCLHLLAHLTERLSADVAGIPGTTRQGGHVGGTGRHLFDRRGNRRHARRSFTHRMLLTFQPLIHAVGVMRDLCGSNGRGAGLLNQAMRHLA